MFGLLKKIFGSAQDRMVRKFRKVVAQVNEWDEKYKRLSDDELKGKTEEFRQRVKEGESLDDLLPEAYGVVKNCCRRLCGKDVHVSGYEQKWDMVPYDVQMLGAIAMHKGSIAEMMTGEGKTLTAVLPCYLNALTGKPVHLVTVNDYLADRDCQWVGAVLRWLGLTTAALTNQVSPQQRREIYEADVVYGTASEFGFDYLRDNSMVMRKEDQVQRGHYYAIVDEVDSILIDEARTPLIISGPAPDSRQMYDELKGGVGVLVRKQRDACNGMAAEAKKVLEKHGYTKEASPEGKLEKAAQEEVQEAFRKLWLVGKGTPRNKVLRRMMENPDIRAAIDEWDLYYYGDQSKEEKAEALSQLYILIDEKSSEYELMDKGILAWEKEVEGASADDFVMMDISAAFIDIDEDSSLSEEEKMKKKLEVQDEDAKRKERAHNLRQLLRAHLLMEKDVEYIIQDQKVVIIDENTGRPQPGRRFSDGLHQAIEAKEGLAIQKETQTYATVTLQNYFRMYERLSGMTGTAVTEAGEFKEIYELEVLEIPTHKKCLREDANDEIYMTEREKYNAILKEIQEVHQKGRPILIGTESVEVSEKLSRILKQNKLPHTVLNARHHEQEASIIAEAGRPGAITVSTNMAGRGTDIKLGEGVAQLGGLHVIGTTRHSSRRIDRQLRGRCARQGDPGTSKFYVSFEDELMRLFSSPRITGLLQKLRPPEGEPISASILNRSIETAQKRVEQRNFMIRKHTLEYDDVMNKQRKEIYSFRNEMLLTREIFEFAEHVLADVCSMEADQYFKSRSEEGGWDPEGYSQWLMQTFPVRFEEDLFDDDLMDLEEIETRASNTVIASLRRKIEADLKRTEQHDPEAFQDATKDNPVEHGVRHMMIRVLDRLWKLHLLAMDHLRAEVNLRRVAQKDPLVEFKHEAFRLFDELGVEIRTEIAHSLFDLHVVTLDEMNVNDLFKKLSLETNRSLVGEMGGGGQQPVLPPQPAKRKEEKLEPVVVAEPRIGRNDLCPCGSGKKYKKCCGKHQDDGLA